MASLPYKECMDKNAKELTDNQLMHMFIHDDDHVAFERLYHRYKEALLRFSYGYTFNQARAEENVHETFLKVYRHRRHFDAKRSFKGWLWTICKNTNLDHLGKMKREPDEVFTDEIDVQSIEDSVLEKLIQEASRKKLHQALELLSLSQREATLMWMNDDLSFEEMGVILHKSPQAVKNLVHRAKNSLKELLSQGDF